MDKKLPLFIVTGASGSGKTTVIKELRDQLPDVDVFDIDTIQPFIGDDWSRIRNIWFRIARSIAESGRITIICGTLMPWDAEKCEDYNFFNQIYYLNLHCNDETREVRLKARDWSDDMIQEHISFAQWLLENAHIAYPTPMPTIDTTNMDVRTVAFHITEWIHSHSDS